MNPEARRLLGTGEDESASISQLLPEIRNLLEGARSHSGEFESAISGESGDARWLAVRHAAIGGDGSCKGQPNASVFILRDVSERKRFEKTRDLLQRRQALSEMSAVLAHEMRNPLGSLELFSGLLAGSDLGSEQKGWIEQVQAGLRTLGATVNNVLHFHSLPEAERTVVDLGRLLDWAATFFVPVAKQAGVELSLHNRLGGVLIQADRHRLEQVLLNLVLNAVRAMPGGGWIELKGSRIQQGKAASIVVSDTGPGISPEDLSRVFEAGFSTRAGSPGLGLAVCRKILEQHGGSITAASRSGNGATFTVILPLTVAELRHGVPA
jgi:signal transduction histidine kinase